MKRFSLRETALLSVPVMLIGLLGLWISKHPLPDEPQNSAPALIVVPGPGMAAMPVAGAAPMPAAGAAPMPGAAPMLGAGGPVPTSGPATGAGLPSPSTLPYKLIVPGAKDKISLRLHLKKPTLLEAFAGYDCVAEVEGRGADGGFQQVSQLAPYLELQTASGAKRLSYQAGVLQKIFAPGNGQAFSYPLQLHRLPPGQVSFGLNASVFYLSPNPSLYSYGYTPLYGKCLINRARFAPRNLSLMSRQPLIKLLEVKVSSVALYSVVYGGPRVSGEMTFQINSNPISLQTPMEFKIGSSDAIIESPSSKDSWLKPAKTPRLRISLWTLSSILTTKPKVAMTGRISANKRWPLGFEIEPFDFNTAKVGQRLKFKQFPVPLPKG